MTWEAISKSILNWKWYNDQTAKVLFLHLILKANTEEKMTESGIVKCGQFLTNSPHLEASLGLTRQEVRTGLRKLETSGDIAIQKVGKRMLISIQNHVIFDNILTWQKWGKNEGSNQSSTNLLLVSNQSETPSNALSNMGVNPPKKLVSNQSFLKKQPIFNQSLPNSPRAREEELDIVKSSSHPNTPNYVSRISVTSLTSSSLSPISSFPSSSSPKIAKRSQVTEEELKKKIEALKNDFFRSQLKLETAMRQTGVSDLDKLRKMCEEIFEEWEFVIVRDVSYRHLLNHLRIKAKIMREQPKATREQRQAQELAALQQLENTIKTQTNAINHNNEKPPF